MSESEDLRVAGVAGRAQPSKPCQEQSGEGCERDHGRVDGSGLADVAKPPETRGGCVLLAVRCVRLLSSSLGSLVVTVGVVSDLPDLRDHVREESVGDARVVVRGGPDTVAKIRAHAERLERAYVLDGEPVLGVSAFAVFDDVGPASMSGVFGRLSTYRTVHVAPASALVDGGFELLETFQRPHVTVLIRSLDDADRLLDLFGPGQDNPRYGEMTRRSIRR